MYNVNNTTKESGIPKELQCGFSMFKSILMLLEPLQAMILKIKEFIIQCINVAVLSKMIYNILLKSEFPDCSIQPINCAGHFAVHRSAR